MQTSEEGQEGSWPLLWRRAEMPTDTVSACFLAVVLPGVAPTQTGRVWGRAGSRHVHPGRHVAVLRFGWILYSVTGQVINTIIPKLRLFLFPPHFCLNHGIATPKQIVRSGAYHRSDPLPLVSMLMFLLPSEEGGTG